MAGNQPARRDAGAFDIQDWMAQRQADVQRLLQGAETEGRRLWAQSTKTGENLSAPNPGDIVVLGLQNRATAQGRATTSQVGAADWDHNPRAKALGGLAALVAGDAAGVIRAGAHTAESVGDSVALGARILDPFDRALSPPDQRPAEQLIRAAGNTVDGALNALAHPADQLHKWNIELNPLATPQADTFVGELNRNFRIGKNQGDFGANAAALAFGSGALKVVPRLAPISEAAGTAKFIKQGFSPQEAAHLAEPYDGMGHHFVPRRFNVLPPDLSDSIFNVLKPTNISRGDFYELHYKVDPEFDGAKGWSGKALGLKDKRYGLLGRLWHGSPAALNAASGVAGSVGLAKYNSANGDGS